MEEKKEIVETTNSQSDELWDGINGVRPKDPNESLEYPLKEKIKAFLSEYTVAKTEEAKEAAKTKFSEAIKDCKSKTSVLAAMVDVFRNKIEGYEFVCSELQRLLNDNYTPPVEDFSKEYAVESDSMVQRIRDLGKEELSKSSNTTYIDENGRMTNKKPLI